MSEITTTLVVNFATGAGDAGFLSAQIDGREDGFNQGRSRFTAGDQPVYLIFKTSNVNVLSQTPSYGAVAFHASGQLDVEQVLTFANTREASLSQPAIPGTLDVKWIGNDLGALTLQSDERTVLASVTGVGVAKVSYKVDFTAYRLTNVIVPDPVHGETDFSVLVYIVGETT